MQTRAQVKSLTLKNNNRILVFIMFLLKCKINITRGLYFMVPSQLQGSGRLVDIPAMRLRSPGLLYDHSIVGSLFLEALPSVLRASCHCFSSYGSSHTHTLTNTHLSFSLSLPLIHPLFFSLPPSRGNRPNEGRHPPVLALPLSPPSLLTFSVILEALLLKSKLPLVGT